MPGLSGLSGPQSVANNIDPETGRPYSFVQGNTTSLNGGPGSWLYADQMQAVGDQGSSGGALNTMFGGAFNYTPEFLQSIGFSGNPYQQEYGENAGTQQSMNPEFTQYLQDHGLRLAASMTGNEADQWARGRAFDAQGNPVGAETRWRPDVNSDAFFAAMLAAGAFGGSMAAGGAAGGVGAGTQGGATNAALIESQAGTAGYGASSVGAGANAYGAGLAYPAGIGAEQAAYGALENGASYGSGAGNSLVASSEPGLGGALGEGTTTGLSYANPAGLEGAATGAGEGGFGGGGLFGGSGTTATGFGGTGLTSGEILAGGAGASSLAGMGASGYGSNNSVGGFDYSGGAGSSTIDQLRNLLTNQNGSGLSGLGQGLLGLGTSALGGALGRGNTGDLNSVNYQQAATAQGQSARTNQTNAQGSLTYNQNGTDAQGNPTYSQDVRLNAPYQHNLDQALGNQSTALGNLQNYNSGLPGAYAGVPGLYGDAGSQEGLVKQAQDAIYNRQATYLDPQYQQRQDQLGQQLANQGVTYGSDAYNNAMRQFSSDRDNAYSSLRNDAITQGNAYANQLFGQNLQAHQQGYSDINNQGSNYAGQAGSAMNGVTQNPTFATAPPATNYLGAAQLQGNANLNQYNANIGNTNNLTNGLTGIGTSLASNSDFWSGLGSLFGGSKG